MEKLANILNKANEILILKIFTPIFCVAALIALLLYVAVKKLPLDKLPVKIKKCIIALAKVASKVFTAIGGLPTKKTIMIAVIPYAVLGLVIALSAKPINIIWLILGPVLCAVIAAGCVFIILLGAKGLAVALGNVMGELGDQDAYNDVVRSVDGKYIVFKGEDASKYPEDLVVYRDETREECETRQRAGEKERQQHYREQKKAQDQYIRAKHKYDSAATLYRQSVATGDTTSAQLYKADMEKALVDMKNSGYSE